MSVAPASQPLQTDETTREKSRTSVSQPASGSKAPRSPGLSTSTTVCDPTYRR